MVVGSGSSPEMRVKSSSSSMIRSQRMTLRSMRSSARWTRGVISFKPSRTMKLDVRITPRGLRSSWLTVAVNWPSVARRSWRRRSACAARNSAVRSSTRRSRFAFSL